MKVHDTLTGEYVEVGGLGTVGMYVCGPTVYDDAHVGHARSAIIFDVVRRWLEAGSSSVTLVQNFTDVDDKILERAAAAGEDPTALAMRYMTRYIEDAKSLNLLAPTHAPKATAHIPQIIDMIGRLVGAGAAYVTESGVYFDVGGFAEYGKLSGKKTDELVAGARVAVDSSKRNPLDFALWKTGDGDLSWQSPWGRGRPGWHIECSAMADKYLPSRIDIHGGGRDLIFPHHENEIAQSESCTGYRLARSWMHVGMVTVNGEKMSKSAGNSRTVRGAVSEWGASALRIFCLGARYAKPVDYSDVVMSECTVRWRQAEACHYELRRAGVAPSAYTGYVLWAEFARALDDDCDTRRALDALFGLAGSINDAAADGRLSDVHGEACGAFHAMMGVLGLEVRRIPEDTEKVLDALADKRESQRAQAKYDEADKVRDEMVSMGADVLDHGGRTVWVIRERGKV